MNKPSSMFVSLPPIPNIEFFSRSTISSLGSGSFGRNRYYVNNKQQTTSEVSDTETTMADNEELYPPSPQNQSNVFEAEDLSSCSSSSSAEYERAWIKANVIRSSILSTGECSDAFSRSLCIALNHKEIVPIITVTGAIVPKQYTNAITQHERKKQYCPMQHP